MESGVDIVRRYLRGDRILVERKGASCLYRSVDIFVPPVRRVCRGMSEERLFQVICSNLSLECAFNLKNIGGIEFETIIRLLRIVLLSFNAVVRRRYDRWM